MFHMKKQGKSSEKKKKLMKWRLKILTDTEFKAAAINAHQTWENSGTQLELKIRVRRYKKKTYQSWRIQ